MCTVVSGIIIWDGGGTNHNHQPPTTNRNTKARGVVVFCRSARHAHTHTHTHNTTPYRIESHRIYSDTPSWMDVILPSITHCTHIDRSRTTTQLTSHHIYFHLDRGGGRGGGMRWKQNDPEQHNKNRVSCCVWNVTSRHVTL